MNCGQLEMISRQNVQTVPVEPHVKSAKMCKLSLSSMTQTYETRHFRGPHLLRCCCRLGNQRDGLFDIVEMKMERKVAINKLGKLLGKKLGYRVDDRAPSPEERAEARAALAPAIEERNKLKEQRDARYKAILAADAEYQSLAAAATIAGKNVDKLSSITRWYKITVGTSEGMFFFNRAEGDSWEDVIDKLTTEKQKAT